MNIPLHDCCLRLLLPLPVALQQHVIMMTPGSRDEGEPFDAGLEQKKKSCGEGCEPPLNIAMINLEI